MENSGPATFAFQAEIKQLLHLMVHSLYSEREIFLRELISNASDANDRLRFESLAHPELLASDPELAIRVTVDAEQRLLSVTDNGIGMSREEVVDHLGTIARSGTGQFLQRLTGDQRKDAQLIGQFGVGFYSAFIVADEVTRADAPRRRHRRARSVVGVGRAGRVSRRDRRARRTRHDGAAKAESRCRRVSAARAVESPDSQILGPHCVPRAVGRRGSKPTRQSTKQSAVGAAAHRIKDEEYVEFYKHIRTTAKTR